MARNNPKRPISAAEYTFLLTHLEEEMIEYEAQTRRNSGHNRGGIRVLHGDTFQFAKFSLETAWKKLHELSITDPQRHSRIKAGMEGQYFAVEIAASKYAALNQHTARQRAEFAVSDQIDRKPTGKPVILHNSERSVKNWRDKLTSSVTLHHANGATSQGFDLFSEWVGIGPDGRPSEKGRCGVIGFINLKFVFGPDFKAQNTQNTENKEVRAISDNADNESFSANTPTKNKKNKEDRFEAEFIFSQAEPEQKQKTEKLEDQQDAKAALGTSANLQEKKEEQPPSCATPPQDPGISSRMMSALRLWAFLFTRVYFPMIAAGRVRYNSEKSFEKTTFSGGVQQKSAEMIYDLLGTYSEEVIKNAIESQAKWLESDEKRWIYTPTTFLNRDMAHGGMVSAIRELVRPGKETTIAPKAPEEPVSNRENDLYSWILRLGCKNTRIHTFRKWIISHGQEYVAGAIRELQAEIHRRRQNGAVVGKEFEKLQGGTSAKLAKLVYYGYSNEANNALTQMKELRTRLRIECNEPKWQPVINEVRSLDVDTLRILFSNTVHFTGYKLQDLSELNNPANAVLFAWTWHHYVKPSLSK